MKNKTVEEMYVEMLKPAETVSLRVQQRPDDFNMVKDTPGDGFYIRYTHTSPKCLFHDAPVKPMERNSFFI